MTGSSKSKFLPLTTIALILASAYVLYRLMVAFYCANSAMPVFVDACIDSTHYQILKCMAALGVGIYAVLDGIRRSQ